MRGLVVGRFQPFHGGHLAVLKELLARAPERELLIVIGSADAAYTWENPFTAGERYEMIVRAVREARLAGVSIVPVEDIHRHTMWVAYLAGLLPPFDRVFTNNPLTRLLFEKAGYRVESPELVDRGRLEGAQIRARLARGDDVRDVVPPAVAAYLLEIGAGSRLALLRPAVDVPGVPHRT